jgi:phospholipid/cholesterol/gamma-HCH transport system permease protein
MFFNSRLFVNREKFSVYRQLFFEESMIIGIDTVAIVVIISSFIGAVTAIQTEANLVSPFIPSHLVAVAVRDMTILELGPTITALVFAGKVGSNIAGGLGTMRITEQIDALEVMGINSISYLVLPKILSSMFCYPLLVILACSLSIFGGFVASVATGILTAEQYIYGLRLDWVAFNVPFALIKAVVFAFLISSISSYKGFYTRGGALEVGIASTKAVTNSCIAVLIADYLLAQVLL